MLFIYLLPYISHSALREFKKIHGAKSEQIQVPEVSVRVFKSTQVMGPVSGCVVSESCQQKEEVMTEFARGTAI